MAKRPESIKTSDTAPKTGNTVLVEGTLNKDIDLGSGFKYSAIIENAIVKIEK